MNSYEFNKAAAQIPNPIIKIIDWGDRGKGTLYFVMCCSQTDEYCEYTIYRTYNKAYAEKALKKYNRWLTLFTCAARTRADFQNAFKAIGGNP